jgi:predicted ATP-dependent endonuclease of OLD family
MIPIDQLGDGIRSYSGIILNFVADPRPVTIIDEPEAFLHPPQALKLGKELANLVYSENRQAIIATHSSDIIRGAMSAGVSVQFLYLDHNRVQRQYHIVTSEQVAKFSAEPFLTHTNALDCLFYAQVVVCEAEADIMFFKWAAEKSGKADNIEETFWIPSYGKTAVPSIIRSLNGLGVKAKCIFDIDVLLSIGIIEDVCAELNIDIAKYKGFLKNLPSHIKVPPAAQALKEIEEVISATSDDDSDESRLSSIRLIKKSAESLSRSWSLKATGLRLLPKGEVRKCAEEFISYLQTHGVIILREGELENYVPDIGGHGKGWVRQAIEKGQIEDSLEKSLMTQLEHIISR